MSESLTINEVLDLAYEEILDRASFFYREWNRRGVRGQAVRPQDGFDYWVIKATLEYCNREHGK